MRILVFRKREVEIATSSTCTSPTPKVAGAAALISFKPNGVASTQQASAGTPRGAAEYRESRVARSFSLDASECSLRLGKLRHCGFSLVRVNADQDQGAVSGGKCTPVAISEGKACTFEISAGSAQFWTAATDGSRPIDSEERTCSNTTSPKPGWRSG